MARLLIRIVVGLALVAAVVYAADWAVWRVRMARGNGLDEVPVTQMSVATLKRDKEEYYFDGNITMSCAKSLLPPMTDQGWMTPCWYLRRNKTVITRY